MFRKAWLIRRKANNLHIVLDRVERRCKQLFRSLMEKYEIF